MENPNEGDIFIIMSARLDKTCVGSVFSHYEPIKKQLQDYYPFGMLLPGRRKDPAEGYRYGFQGQERDDEISGSGNSMTAMYWQYDTRLGRRWNQDPKPNPSISNYATFANNPIWYTDPFGDTLDVGANASSQKDLLSIVKPKYRDNVQFEGEGVHQRVSINLEGKDLKKALRRDKGLALINDAVSSDKKMLFETSNVFYSNGKAMPMFLRDHGVVNASKYGKDSNGGYYDEPASGYDGHVVIDPSVRLTETRNGITRIKRAAVVFHELAENFERTHNGIDYRGSTGAHNTANMREGRWHGRSWYPGQIDPIKRTTPSRDYQEVLFQLINNYTNE